ncbi:MAG: hypothetical protein JW759_03730 [Candidatus Coatesbacteria bacterium]|nr:hypothetical protein [Candidatus Coatesbacteria bacterium]
MARKGEKVIYVGVLLAAPFSDVTACPSRAQQAALLPDVDRSALAGWEARPTLRG